MRRKPNITNETNGLKNGQQEHKKELDESNDFFGGGGADYRDFHGISKLFKPEGTTDEEKKESFLKQLNDMKEAFRKGNPAEMKKLYLAQRFSSPEAQDRRFKSHLFRSPLKRKKIARMQVA